MSSPRPPYERPVAMALDVLVSQRIVAGQAVEIAGVTALREKLEDAVTCALDGVEVGEMPTDWSVDEALEQVALHAVMDRMFTSLL